MRQPAAWWMDRKSSTPLGGMVGASSHACTHAIPTSLPACPPVPLSSTRDRYAMSNWYFCRSQSLLLQKCHKGKGKVIASLSLLRLSPSLPCLPAFPALPCPVLHLLPNTLNVAFYDMMRGEYRGEDDERKRQHGAKREERRRERWGECGVKRGERWGRLLPRFHWWHWDTHMVICHHRSASGFISRLPASHLSIHTHACLPASRLPLKAIIVSLPASPQLGPLFPWFGAHWRLPSRSPTNKGLENWNIFHNASLININRELFQ